MMKRATWFIGGVAAGFAGAGYARRKVRATAAQFAPTRVARTAVGRARTVVDRAADSVREGKRAMRATEEELAARRDGRAASLAEVLGPDDEVRVDGIPVDASEVVVLRASDRTSPGSSTRATRRSR